MKKGEETFNKEKMERECKILLTPKRRVRKKMLRDKRQISWIKKTNNDNKRGVIKIKGNNKIKTHMEEGKSSKWN